MKTTIAFALCAVLTAVPALAVKSPKGTPPGQAKHDGMQPRASGDGVPSGLAKKSGVPPGLAKKGGIPPGLAKKFGVRPPAIRYIAIDPRFDDRAWFLIDNKWTLKTGFDAPLKLELRDSLKRPSVSSPIPLPRIPDPLHVISFK
ncbi:MAG: hypothetical protein ACSLFQ_03705 [Thermoanaerobaculia bacterium]